MLLFSAINMLEKREIESFAPIRSIYTDFSHQFKERELLSFAVQFLISTATDSRCYKCFFRIILTLEINSFELKLDILMVALSCHLKGAFEAVIWTLPDPKDALDALSKRIGIDTVMDGIIKTPDNSIKIMMLDASAREFLLHSIDYEMVVCSALRCGRSSKGMDFMLYQGGITLATRLCVLGYPAYRNAYGQGMTKLTNHLVSRNNALNLMSATGNTLEHASFRARMRVWKVLKLMVDLTKFFKRIYDSASDSQPLVDLADPLYIIFNTPIESEISDPDIIQYARRATAGMGVDMDFVAYLNK
jgi:hypothetical protein